MDFRLRRLNERLVSLLVQKAHGHQRYPFFRFAALVLLALLAYALRANPETPRTPNSVFEARSEPRDSFPLPQILPSLPPCDTGFLEHGGCHSLWNCFEKRLRLRAGLTPWKGWRGITEMPTTSFRLESAISQIAVHSALPNSLHSWRNGAVAAASFSSFASLPFCDGSSTLNVAPPVGWFFTRMVPPCSVTMP